MYTVITLFTTFDLKMSLSYPDMLCLEIKVNKILYISIKCLRIGLNTLCFVRLTSVDSVSIVKVLCFSACLIQPSERLLHTENHYHVVQNSTERIG